VVAVDSLSVAGFAHFAADLKHVLAAFHGVPDATGAISILNNPVRQKHMVQLKRHLAKAGNGLFFIGFYRT
jgi:hypothetical protein